MKNPFPSANNWKRILLDIYGHCPNVYFENHRVNFWDDKHFLAKKLNLKGSEVGISIEFLKKNGLIEDKNHFTPLKVKPLAPEWQNNISLTEKGFNVALELDKQAREIREKKRFEKLQWAIIILTAVLAVTGASNIFS